MPRFFGSAVRHLPVWPERILKLQENKLQKTLAVSLKGIIALLAATTAAISWAGEQGSLPTDVRGMSIGSAIESALANNPDMAAAEWDASIAQGERQQAGLIPNPEISWEAEDTRSDTRTTTVQITQPIELGGKRGARIQLAERGQDVVAVDLQRKRNALRAGVIQAFYGALRAQARLDLAEESLSVAERGKAAVDGRIRAGKSSPVEGTRAQVQLSEVRLEVNRANMALSNAYQQLDAIIGSSSSSEAKIQGDTAHLPRIPTASALQRLLPETAEMRLTAIQITQQEASLGLEKAQRIPDLNISIGSQYSEEDRERVNVVGFSMPIPLFNRNQGNVLAAARRADQARDLRNATELRLRTETQQALEQWSTAAKEVESFEGSILPAAQSAVDSATRGFEMGKFSFLDVLDAQRALIAARTQYIQSIAEATDAWVRIERIFGDVSKLSSEF
ncbi:TolC family protein [Metapseudomonas furukawaii]|uniref:TolC family protein n=1 Tax=Metapseudomonas furukawaii TaxID=1149133 RepID=UPI00227D4329|nr:TolC family protein [Pseudomonas furukawaii]WAG78883.1 TolC family protein [Pseudomonas furukawaii]